MLGIAIGVEVTVGIKVGVAVSVGVGVVVNVAVSVAVGDGFVDGVAVNATVGEVPESGAPARWQAGRKSEMQSAAVIISFCFMRPPFILLLSTHKHPHWEER
jgi:hypothetical protein